MSTILSAQTALGNTSGNSGVLFNITPRNSLCRIPGTSTLYTISPLSNATWKILKSTDNGVTWSAGVTIPGAVSYAYASYGMAYNSANNYIYISITDGGASWNLYKYNCGTDAVTLLSNYLTGMSASMYTSMGFDQDNNLHIYSGKYVTGDIRVTYYYKFNPVTETFIYSAVPLNTGYGSTRAYAYDIAILAPAPPALPGSIGALYAFTVYTTQSSGYFGLRYNKSTDGGATWGSSVDVLNYGFSGRISPNVNNAISICVTDTNEIIVAWSDFGGSGAWAPIKVFKFVDGYIESDYIANSLFKTITDSSSSIAPQFFMNNLVLTQTSPNTVTLFGAKSNALANELSRWDCSDLSNFASSWSSQQQIITNDAGATLPFAVAAGEQTFYNSTFSPTQPHLDLLYTNNNAGIPANADLYYLSGLGALYDPTTVSGFPLGLHQIQISWVDNKNIGLDGYKIEYNDGSWHTAGTAGPGVFTYILSSLDADTLYTFRVSAYRGVNYSSAILGLGVTTYSATTPALPSDISVSYDEPNHLIHVDWANNARATNVQLYRQVDAGAHTYTYQLQTYNSEITHPAIAGSVGDIQTPLSDQLVVDVKLEQVGQAAVQGIQDYAYQGLPNGYAAAFTCDTNYVTLIAVEGGPPAGIELYAGPTPDSGAWIGTAFRDVASDYITPGGRTMYACKFDPPIDISAIAPARLSFVLNGGYMNVPQAPNNNGSTEGSGARNLIHDEVGWHEQFFTWGGPTHWYQMASFYAWGTNTVTPALPDSFTDPADPLNVAPQVSIGTPVVQDCHSVNIAWSITAGTPDHMYLERNDGAGWNPIFDAASALSYSDSGMTPETSHQYRVRAKDGAIYGDWSSSGSATTGRQLTGPSAISIAQISGSVNLNWAVGSSGVTLNIFRSVDDGGYSPYTTIGSGNASWSDTSVNLLSKYQYQVVASNSGDCSSPTSTSPAIVYNPVTIPPPTLRYPIHRRRVPNNDKLEDI